MGRLYDDGSRSELLKWEELKQKVERMREKLVDVREKWASYEERAQQFLEHHYDWRTHLPRLSPEQRSLLASFRVEQERIEQSIREWERELADVEHNMARSSVREHLMRHGWLNAEGQNTT